MDPAKICTPLGGDGVNCIPGCYSVGRQCADMQRDWLCSYPPSQLSEALLAQTRREGGLSRNNEIVVDTRSMVASLPDSVLAFFIVKGSPAYERDKVLQAHDAFLREYPRLPVLMRPPLLSLDLNHDGLTPFSPWTGP
jgi:hypothetical protein